MSAMAMADTKSIYTRNRVALLAIFIWGFLPRLSVY